MMWLALTAINWTDKVCGSLFVALKCYKELCSSGLNDWLNSALLAHRVNYFNGLSYD